MEKHISNIDSDDNHNKKKSLIQSEAFPGILLVIAAMLALILTLRLPLTKDGIRIMI